MKNLNLYANILINRSFYVSGTKSCESISSLVDNECDYLIEDDRSEGDFALEYMQQAESYITSQARNVNSNTSADTTPNATHYGGNTSTDVEPNEKSMSGNGALYTRQYDAGVILGQSEWNEREIHMSKHKSALQKACTEAINGTKTLISRLEDGRIVLEDRRVVRDNSTAGEMACDDRRVVLESGRTTGPEMHCDRLAGLKVQEMDGQNRLRDMQSEDNMKQIGLEKTYGKKDRAYRGSGESYCAGVQGRHVESGETYCAGVEGRHVESDKSYYIGVEGRHVESLMSGKGEDTMSAPPTDELREDKYICTDGGKSDVNCMEYTHELMDGCGSDPECILTHDGKEEEQGISYGNSVNGDNLSSCRNGIQGNELSCLHSGCDRSHDQSEVSHDQEDGYLLAGGGDESSLVLRQTHSQVEPASQCLIRRQARTGSRAATANTSDAKAEARSAPASAEQLTSQPLLTTSSSSVTAQLQCDTALRQAQAGGQTLSTPSSDPATLVDHTGVCQPSSDPATLVDHTGVCQHIQCNSPGGMDNGQLAQIALARHAEEGVVYGVQGGIVPDVQHVEASLMAHNGGTLQLHNGQEGQEGPDRNVTHRTVQEDPCSNITYRTMQEDQSTQDTCPIYNDQTQVTDGDAVTLRDRGQHEWGHGYSNAMDSVEPGLKHNGNSMESASGDGEQSLSDSGKMLHCTASGEVLPEQTDCKLPSESEPKQCNLLPGENEPEHCTRLNGEYKGITCSTSRESYCESSKVTIEGPPDDGIYDTMWDNTTSCAEDRPALGSNPDVDLQLCVGFSEPGSAKQSGTASLGLDEPLGPISTQCQAQSASTVVRQGDLGDLHSVTGPLCIVSPVVTHPALHTDIPTSCKLMESTAKCEPLNSKSPSIPLESEPSRHLQCDVQLVPTHEQPVANSPAHIEPYTDPLEEINTQQMDHSMDIMTGGTSKGSHNSLVKQNLLQGHSEGNKEIQGQLSCNVLEPGLSKHQGCDITPDANTNNQSMLPVTGCPSSVHNNNKAITSGKGVFIIYKTYGWVSNFLAKLEGDGFVIICTPGGWVMCFYQSK